MQRLVIESIFVGIALVVIGTLIAPVVGKFFKVDLPKECKEWNKFYTMEVSLFVIGFLAHMLFEFTGLNKWY